MKIQDQCLMLAITGAVCFPAAQLIARESEHYYKRPYEVDSGEHDNSTMEPAILAEHEARIADARWLRVHFADYKLGEGSYLRLQSLKDGAVQRRD